MRHCAGIRTDCCFNFSPRPQTCTGLGCLGGRLRRFRTDTAPTPAAHKARLVAAAVRAQHAWRLRPEASQLHICTCLRGGVRLLWLRKAAYWQRRLQASVTCVLKHKCTQPYTRLLSEMYWQTMCPPHDQQVAAAVALTGLCASARWATPYLAQLGVPAWLRAARPRAFVAAPLCCEWLSQHMSCGRGGRVTPGRIFKRARGGDNGAQIASGTQSVAEWQNVTRTLMLLRTPAAASGGSGRLADRSGERCSLKTVRQRVTTR